MKIPLVFANVCFIDAINAIINSYKISLSKHNIINCFIKQKLDNLTPLKYINNSNLENNGELTKSNNFS